jgi:serine/threonine-protein kinase RsbT
MERMKSGELPIKSESDIVACRKTIRDQATSAGFGVTDVTRIVTAVSELARNVYAHADEGVMLWIFLAQPGKVGIELVFKDQGKGIDSVEQAMLPGYSTTKSMGMGLPGVKRLMDEMEIDSETGIGTTVKVRKWKKA